MISPFYRGYFIGKVFAENCSIVQIELHIME
ncbi:hypothetical protein N783_09500 [Pontibacillus marinus BH030004 = DSM 16465]|uniref:Uncharacterized protein n=1 Tax=Pontibacillus marinus BH030004 = DSM 16465 TaxID=1385511 RepID=A0A0A5HVH3_9BACI|nr:hypothetical protein N783_09500 [Pontibacillus marinus BH030004 = DSM 16465]